MKSRQASAASTSTSRARRRLARPVDRLARPQQRLRRDAGPVGALAPDELALDDGDAQAALGQRAGAVLARRAAAEDDDVVVAAHVGSSSPARSRTMYSAYQSGQSGSRLPDSLLVLAVCRRGPRSALGEVRRRLDMSWASSALSGRAAGVVISWSSQPLPSGSLKVANERRCRGRRRPAPATRPARWKRAPASALVEHLAHLDAAREQFVTRRLDVGDDQVQALGRAGRGRRDVRAETGSSTRSPAA